MERRIQIKRIIEALLFSSSEPLSLEKLKEIINTEIAIRKDELRELIAELRKNYKEEQRAVQIDEIAEGLLLRTCKEMHPFVSLLHSKRKTEKLGPAAMEVVAIIAYRSPITKSEIEQIRGVDCSGPLQTLLERDLVTVVGHKESLGRPRQYGITKRFLTHFGLNQVQDLTAGNPVLETPIV
jgi:segregation and condensation protein B